MSLGWFPIAVLGVWRITHLLVAEDGPADILVKLRAALGNGFWGTLLDCFYCASLWVALPFAFTLGASWLERLLLWPALSGGAILVERLTRRSAPALYVEHQEVDPTPVEREDHDGVLRR
jgi:hypothetical protein